MKIFRTLLLVCLLTGGVSFAQDVALEELPSATLNTDFYLTLDPSVPISPYYKADISHLGFESEEEAIKVCRIYLTGNLISNEVHFSENYVLIHIHTEYLNGDFDYAKVQNYLGQLTKPN